MFAYIEVTEARSLKNKALKRKVVPFTQTFTLLYETWSACNKSSL